jgi:hypothetical protein
VFWFSAGAINIGEGEVPNGVFDALVRNLSTPVPNSKGVVVAVPIDTIAIMP